MLGFGDDRKQSTTEVPTNSSPPQPSRIEEIEAVAESLRPRVLDFLQQADKEVGIREVRSALGYPSEYLDRNPQTNPVNRILKQMRDAGEVVCREFERGESLVSLPTRIDSVQAQPRAKINGHAVQPTKEPQPTGEKARARDILAAIRTVNDHSRRSSRR